MTNDALWFAALCVQEGVIDAKLVARLIPALPAGADAAAFGQALLDNSFCGDATLVGRLVARAVEKAQSGEPPTGFGGEADAASSGEEADFAQVQHLSDEELMNFMRQLLAACGELGASDLHLSAGARPFIRNNRVLEFIDGQPLGAADAQRLNTCLLSPEDAEAFARDKDLDFALALPGGARFRVNLMVHKNGAAGTYRLVPETLRPLTGLGFKNLDAIKRLLSYHNGLILVTGPVGSGKTTTLNALVHELNTSREDHIITVEDPLEFIHVSRGCNVTQRQAGRHTASFQTALKGALREDPDIIVIGELRDLETIEMAISASETGHLVIGTMHTSDAGTTLNRVLDVFPPAQQAQIRAMVAESLRGIICQRLLPTRAGGVVLACELLINNLAVASMIRDGKSQGLVNVLETGKKDGMLLMDNSVYELWQAGVITDETALANLVNKMIRQRVIAGEK
jgi:twitching motility protein PilT